MANLRKALEFAVLVCANVAVLVGLGMVGSSAGSNWLVYGAVVGLSAWMWFPRTATTHSGARVAALVAVLAVQLTVMEVLRWQFGPLSLLWLADLAAVTILLVSGAPLVAARLSGIRLRPLVSARLARTALIVAGVSLLNGLLLAAFNTLLWPYLWPKPLLFVIVSLLGIILWSSSQLYSLTAFRLAGLVMVFTGESYLLHAGQLLVENFDVFALSHFIGFAGMYTAMLVNFINQFSPRDNRIAPPLPDDLPVVAVIIPTYGEPYEVVGKTLLSVRALNYPQDRLVIVVADDGRRRELQALARWLGVEYHPGPRKDAKAGNLNAALNMLARRYPQAALVLTQDADEVIHPDFLQRTVGYFQDPKVAVVQTAKEASVPDSDVFGTRDRLFYDVMQPGRNGRGAAIACGSGVVWRVAALREIGGFATWNVIEDLTTTYYLHSAGYRSEYHNEVLSIGLAPDDIPGLLKQRGTWAVDTWRLMLFDNPILKPGLTLAQRLQYLELGLFYASAVLFTPLLMLTPLISLGTGNYLSIEGAALFPWVASSITYYVILSRGYGAYLLRTWQYWVGLWPTYTKAFLIALFSRRHKPTYKVTRKTRQSGFYGHLLWAQFLYMAAGLAVAAHALLFTPETSLVTQLTNVFLLLFFVFLISPICRAAFFGQSLSPRRLVERLLQPMFGSSFLRRRRAVAWQSSAVTLRTPPYRPRNEAYWRDAGR